jgi:hypothetical protein
MGMFLKCVGMWLLIVWHKENVSVHCNILDVPTRNLHDVEPNSTDVFAKNDTHILVNEVAMKLYPNPNTTAVMEQNTSSEHLDSKEGTDSLSEHVLKLDNETFVDIDHDNRSTRIGDRKGVVHEPEIVPQQDVYSNTEGHGSSVESADENTEQNDHFPDKICVCCLNNTLGIRNGSDDDCKKCCDAMQTGNNASDSVGNETYAAANQIDQDSSLKNGFSSVKQDGHDCSSLDNISTSVTPLSRNRMQLDVTNCSNLLLEPPSVDKDLNSTGYVILVVATLTVLVLVVSAILLYKKRSNFQKWTPRHITDNNKYMVIELINMHEI